MLTIPSCCTSALTWFCTVALLLMSTSSTVPQMILRIPGQNIIYPEKSGTFATEITSLPESTLALAEILNHIDICVVDHVIFLSILTYFPKFYTNMRIWFSCGWLRGCALYSVAFILCWAISFFFLIIILLVRDNCPCSILHATWVSHTFIFLVPVLDVQDIGLVIFKLFNICFMCCNLYCHLLFTHLFILDPSAFLRWLREEIHFVTTATPVSRCSTQLEKYSLIGSSFLWNNKPHFWLSLRIHTVR